MSPVNYIKKLFKRKRQLSSEISPNNSYKIIFPAKGEAIRFANELAWETFSKDDYISADQVKSWVNRNPNILSILIDKKGDFRGYFDVLPLAADFYEAFARGLVTEQDIVPEVILAAGEPCRTLYIGGIASSDRNPIVGSILMTALVLKIKYVYPYFPLTIGAIAATDEGAYYLKQFGFEPGLIGRSGRKDGKDFFYLNLDERDLVGLILDLGKRSKSLDYQAYQWFSVKLKVGT